MILERIRIFGFGRLLDLDLPLHERLTLIFGPNEAGKSTLQQAISCLLFGFFSGTRVTPGEKARWERYTPWRGDRYGGQVWYRLSSGQRIQVDRDFSDPDIPTRVFDALTGAEITDRFPRGRHGNVGFFRKHLGMDREIFEASAFVRQAAVKNIPGASSVMTEIVGILDSGERDTSARQAIERLQRAIREIGSERATKKPLPQLRARLQRLEAELAGILQAREELRSTIQQRNALKRKVAEKSRRSLEWQYLLLTKGIEQQEQQLQRLRTLEKKLEKMRRRLQEFEDVSGFPEEIRDRITRRLQNRQNYKEAVAEASQKVAGFRKEVQNIEQQLEPYRAFEKVASLFSFEEFELQRKHWLEAKRREDEVAEKIRQEEVRYLEQGADPGALRKLREEPPDSLQRINALEREVEQKRLEIKHLREERDTLESQTWAGPAVRRAILWGTPLLTLLVLAVSYFLHFPLGYAMGAGVFLLGSAAYQIYRAARKKIAREADLLAEQIARGETELAELEHELRGKLRPYGAENFADLMKRRTQAEEFFKLEEELSYPRRTRQDAQFQLEKYLQPLNIATVDAEVLEKVRVQFAAFSELQDRLQEQRKLLAAAEKELAGLKERSLENEEILRELLAQTGITDPELDEAEKSYQEKLRRFKQFQQHKKELEQVQAEMDGILAARTPEGLEKELQLMRKRDELLANFPEVRGKTTRLTLPELRRRFEDLDRQRQEDEKELQNLEGKIETLMQRHRPQAEIEEEIAAVRSELNRLEQQRAALEIALEVLREVSQDYHRSLVPYLNEVVSSGLAKVTAGRYREVMVNPHDLSLHVVLPERDTPGAADLLSLGTQEQIYLLLRVALARLLSENLEPVPLILDDPFVHFDRERMANMLGFLRDLSRENQILLFTKEPFIAEWCRRELGEADYRFVELSL